MSAPRLPKLWLALPVLVALCWFWPVLSHGFRSDDYLFVYYIDRATGAVRWDHVFGEFVRPWFGVRDIYRPLVSLSAGVNWWFSTLPFGMHLVNVLLVAATAVAAAAVAALHAERRPAAAGMAAAAIVVLHPATVEPAAWIASRTSGLQVFWTLLAWWAFARHVRGRGPRWPYVLATALALLSKEGAVMLPVSLWMLDLLHGPRAWRERLRLHGPVWFCVGGYLVFRKLLLGWFTTAEGGHGFGERAGNVAVLAGQLLAPPLPGGFSLGGAWFALLLAVLGVAFAAARPRRLPLFAGWIVALLLPTSHAALQDGAFDGRFVYDAVPALGVFVGAAVDACGRKRAQCVAVAGTVALVLVGYGAGSRSWLARYGEDDALVQRVAAEVQAAARAAAPERPLAILGLPGLPVLHPELGALLAQRPFAARDEAVLALPNLLPRDSAAAAHLADAAAVHAIGDAGGAVAMWQGDAGLVVRSRPDAAPFDLLQDSADPGRFLAPAGTRPLAVAAVRVAVPSGSRRVALRLLDDLQGTFAFGERIVDVVPPATEAWFDLSRAVPLLAFDAAGAPFRGVGVTIDGAPPARGALVRVATRLRQQPPIEPLRGRALAAAEFERALRPPADVPLRLCVLTPMGANALAVAPGAPLDLAAASAQVRFAADVLGGCRVHVFWQTPPEHGGEPWRTELDWCEVR